MPKRKSSLLEQMEERLQGARFRWINERLYKSTGSESQALFEKDQGLFSAYHRGFAKQVRQWPINPLDVIIEDIRKKGVGASHLDIADMGCGEGRLSSELGGNETFRVNSFDLVSANPSVTAADISNVPMGNETVDIVVFCLSLMGTNWEDFIAEGSRILRAKFVSTFTFSGLVYIAEVRSRLEGGNEHSFISVLSSHGLAVERKVRLRVLC